MDGDPNHSQPLPPYHDGPSPHTIASSQTPNDDEPQIASPVPSPLHPSSSSSASASSSHSQSDSPSNSTRQASSQSQGRTTSPSTSVWSTPDDPKQLIDPFSALAANEQPADGGVQGPAQSEPLHTPGESVGISTPSSTTPSGTSSSEANDLLGPLPSAHFPSDRPSTSRNLALSNLPTGSFNRIPMPSPPAAWGISELISGSPYHTSSSDSYFVQMPTDAPALHRSGSGSHSRRTPPYSPFRSYYPDSRPSGSRSSLIDSPSFPSVGSETSTSATPRPPSETASSPSHSSQQSRRSPRVRNSGPVLAPHGSFTSAKIRTTPPASARTSAASSDSQLYVGSYRDSRLQGLSLAEKEALTRAAERGDQLAMYRLGWRPETPHDKRYVLGSVEDVWGSVSPYETGTRRSSRSSQGSDYFGTSRYAASVEAARRSPAPLDGHSLAAPADSVMPNIDTDAGHLHDSQ